jgi:hypothetical protein
LYADPDPDPTAQINADPCGSGSGYGSGSETLVYSISQRLGAANNMLRKCSIM